MLETHHVPAEIIKTCFCPDIPTYFVAIGTWLDLMCLVNFDVEISVMAAAVDILVVTNFQFRMKSDQDI